MTSVVTSKRAGAGVRAELAKLVPIAFVGVVLGIASAVVVLDHPVEPLDPPLPQLDDRALDRVAAEDRVVRARVEASPLPAAVRAVGSAFVAWNHAASSGMSPLDPRREDLVRELRTSLGIARDELGGEVALAAALRDLRAYHAEVFLEELRKSAGAAPSDELKKLAGGLLPVLASNRWIDAQNRPQAPEEILRARYKLHWTSVVFMLGDCDQAPPSICYGLTTLPLDAVELRALLAYLVAHPIVRASDAAEAGTADRAVDRRRLLYLDRLAALDQFADPSGQSRPYVRDYPLELGRGALAFRLGRYDVAADELRKWAATHPHDTRARNWYLGALAKARGE